MTDAPIQLLLVEDNPADAVLLKTELTASPFGPFSITHVKRLEEAIKQLGAESFDAVLLDLGLPDSQGLETLRLLQKRKPGDIPIVVLTGLQDEVLGTQALREGAEDYLVKSGSSDGMRARSVRYAIERKRAHEAVVASERRLSLAIDAVKMGIFDWNLATKVVTRSQLYEQLYGVPVESMGTAYDVIERCVHPDDRAALKAKIEHSVATHESYQHEFRVVWPDGSEHWLEVRGRLFDDDQGRVARIMGTIVDISQRKAAEAAAKIRDGELAHLSRVTTMGQMASGLAHELNQPLGAILNYSTICCGQIEAAKGNSETARTAIQEVINETRRAGTIVTRMRSFVRKQQPVSSLLDINELVRQSVHMMDFELRNQRIRPRLELDLNVPKALGDAIQIEQVLVNLIFNGLEAMNDNGSHERRLTLQTAMQDGGRHVQVRVIDTGGGISPENMARLFEPFFTTKKKGLGMGLNICRSIIESQGGRLTVTPNSDRGMQFCFTIPTAGINGR